MNKKITLVVCLAFLLLAALPALGQAGSASVRGKVVDADGNPLEGVKVIFTNPVRPDTSYDGTTNKKGRFTISGLLYDETSKRWSITHRYLWKSEDDDTTDHNAESNIRRDWLFEESRWFYRAAYRWRWDEFKEWQHRISFGTGPGYHIIDRETLDLDGLIGPHGKSP